MKRIVLLILCFIFAFTICQPKMAAQTMITWTGAAGDGSWHTAGNWDLERVPGNSDYVNIPESSVVEYAGGETSVKLYCEGNLTVSGGTLNIGYGNSMLMSGKLDGAGDIVLMANGEFFWNGGSIEGTGKLIINQASRLNAEAPASSLDRYLVNDGSLIIKDSLRLTGGAEGIGYFPIQAEQTLELSGSGSYDLNSLNVNNSGTLRISNTCTSVRFNYDFTQQNSGTLEFDIGGPEDFTKLDVANRATLYGVLKINILDGYVPQTGDIFEILTYGSKTGKFSSIESNLPGITFVPDYTGTGLTLTVATVPTAPQNFTATPGDGEVALSWTAPVSDGGSSITHYEVSSNNGHTWVTADTETSHTFTGLTNGTEYAFKVRAVNSAGNGAEASAAATPTAPAPTQPGQLYTWGNNVHGQLGDGTLQGKSIPTHIGTAEDWTTVSAGDQHTVALKSDGSLWTWGDNHEGRLGDGTSELRKDSPVRIGGDNDWAAAEAGDNHTVALKTDGSLWAWGGNSSGQLGDDSFENRNVPILIDDESTWIAVSAGFYHTVALQADGSLWAWGYNSKGQLGDGSTTSKKVPTQISTEEWAAVSAGTNFTVALKADGSLWTWGLNDVGQLGDGTVVDKNVPTRVGSDTWLAAAAGDNHVVAIKSDGSLWAWGGNEYGELGNGSSDGVSDPPAHPVPTQIGTDTDWIFVSTSYAHNAAFKTDGSLWLWGLSSSGQLGDNTTFSKFTPQRLDGAGTWLAVACGGSHTVATLEAGLTVPTVPQNFTATPGDTQVELSWEAPASDGGAAISHYEVSEDGGTTWVEASTGTSHTFTGLTNGIEYTFKVRAVNSAGNGEEASITATPEAYVCEIGATKYTTLGQALAAVTSGQTIKLLNNNTHTSPIEVDGKTIYFDLGNYDLLLDTSDNPDESIYYVLTVKNGGKVRLAGTGTGKFNVKSSSNSISYGIQVLDANSEVTVNNVDVTGEGAIGIYMYGSGDSLDGGMITVNGHIIAGDMGVNVNAKNGSVIVNGDITAGHSGVQVAANPGTIVTVNGNINVLGTTWQSLKGAGILASGQTTVKVTGDVTGQGTNYTGVHAQGGSIEVEGDVISSGIGAKAEQNVGYPIYNGAVTIDGSLSAGTPFIIVGTTEKTAADITEPTTKPGFLTYSDGTSNVWIGSVGGPVVTAPAAPQNFTATPGDTQVALSWTAPVSDGGSSITHYEVSSDNGHTWVTADTETSHTFTGLTNGTEYAFKVRAVNSVGNGAAASVTATPVAAATVPSAPQDFTATPGDGEVTLSWTAPESHGGSAISHYEVSCDNGDTWVTADTDSSHTFTGLTNGTEYTFKVRAVNSVGNGAEASVSATPSAEFADGSGTEEDPYLISSVYHLNNVRNHLDKHFRLTADLDLSVYGTDEGWEPIGTETNPFTGSFDGDDHIIRNLFIDRFWDPKIGLFGYTGETAKIWDLGLANVNIFGNHDVGGLVGWNEGEIANSWVTGDVTGRSETGGLVGVNHGSITDSWAIGTVTDVWSGSIGGLVAENFGTITKCHAEATVTSDNSNAGGLVGANYGSITESHAVGVVEGSSYVGGLVGLNSEGNIDRCYATGNVTGTEDWINYTFVGGLVGYNRASISNSYAKGAASGAEDIGGLVGCNADTGSITTCYSTGRVSGDSNIGGLVGFSHSDGIITNSYWDANTSQLASSGGGTEKSTAEMKQQATYENWNFDAVWGINGSDNDGYPFLRWQGYEIDPTAPSAPQDFTATPGDGQVVLNWSSPVSDGGSAITHYEVSKDDGTNWTDVGLNTTYTFTGLTNGTVYTFKVRSVNSAGNGEEASTTATPVVLEFAGGNGSEEDPYLIETVDHLNNVRNYLGAEHSDKHFKLNANLNLDVAPYNSNTGWQPIGTLQNPFTSTFDGGGYTISGLFINKEGSWNIRVPSGLFGKSGTEAKISNLTLEDVDITGCYYVGSLVGSNSGEISNVNASGDVVGEWDTGGLAGSNNGSISDSCFVGTVTGVAIVEYGQWTGGLVGYNNLGTISNCWTDVTVVSGYHSIGGLVGENFEGTIRESFSKGTITGYDYTGGLVGSNNDEIISCYSTCTVNGDDQVGGLVGGNSGPITYSFAVGAVNGNAKIGGLVGSNISAPVTGCYWDTETSGKSTSAGGTGKPTAKMKEQATYEGWDFDEVWGINGSDNNGYPFLRWQVSEDAPTVPGVPQNFTATPGDGQVALSWTAPDSDGGSAILKYQVSKDNGTNWSDVGLNSSHTFTGLTNGTEYTFKVRAVNSAGNGEEASATATPTNQQTDECFIATAAFGSKFEPAVVLLRNFRDGYLLTNNIGKTFVEFYYNHSPSIAAYISHSEPLKALVRNLLIPVIAVVYLIMHPGLGIGVLILLSLILALRVSRNRTNTLRI